MQTKEKYCVFLRITAR